MGSKTLFFMGWTPNVKFFHRRITGCAQAFSLVEVTIALGIVSFALLALLGLFVVGLSSSKESAMDTAVAQIALHAATIYDGVDTNLAYSYEGIPKTQVERIFSRILPSRSPEPPGELPILPPISTWSESRSPVTMISTAPTLFKRQSMSPEGSAVHFY